MSIRPSDPIAGLLPFLSSCEPSSARQELQSTHPIFFFRAAFFFVQARFCMTPSRFLLVVFVLPHTFLYYTSDVMFSCLFFFF